MVESRFNYVKTFENFETILPSCYFVVRLDGSGFTKFCEKYKFDKPNDDRGLQLMAAATVAVMADVPDIFFGFTESDEVSFIFKRDFEFFKRRREKIVSSSLITST